jgi:beta-xylosidase
MAPGGGVATGYQIVFRSRSIYGPYESRVVLAQGNTPVNGPHQGGWVQTQTGQDWFVHFQEFLPYGRIVHLEPMTWVDDWPVMGDVGQPVLEHRKPDVGKTWPIVIPQTSDEFDQPMLGVQPALGLQWQWWANYQDDWYSLTARPGFLRLNAVALAEPRTLFDRPNLLLQKFPAERFTATVDLDLSHLTEGDRAGLVVAGMLTAALQVQKDGAGLKIVQTQSISSRPRGLQGDPISGPEVEGNSATLAGQTVFLRLTVEPGAQCSLAYSADNRQFTALGPSFKAVNDLWIGAKVGLFCNAPAAGKSKGFVDVDWFRFSW